MLKLEHISKAFGRVNVLKDVDLTVLKGQIHGIVGLNGSGKSTLLNIISGHSVIHRTKGYSGQMIFENKPVKFQHPGQAVKAGIGMIHQELALLPDMSIARNIKLQREPVYTFPANILGPGGGYVHQREMIAQARKRLESMGLDIDVTLKTGILPVNIKQFVEVAREFDRNDLKLLLLDEPTASLGRDEAQRLMMLLKDISKKDVAVIYVSHRLDEILAICDVITVLVDGCVKKTLIKSSEPDFFDKDRIVELMAGGKIPAIRNIRPPLSNQIKLDFKRFSVEMPGERLNNLSLKVFEGEILGIAALSGHGRPALGAGIMGMYPTTGQVNIGNRKISAFSASSMIQKDVWFIPEDRREMGLLMNHSIIDNVTYGAIWHKHLFLSSVPLGPFKFVLKKRRIQWVNDYVRLLDIKCRSVFQKVKELSGGNQQKVCIAAALTMRPQILFVNEPTRGVDIAAKETILELLLKMNQDFKTTIVMASSELEELRQVASRIAVLYKGGLFDVLSPKADENDFTRALSGER